MIPRLDASASWRERRRGVTGSWPTTPARNTIARMPSRSLEEAIARATESSARALAQELLAIFRRAVLGDVLALSERAPKQSVPAQATSTTPKRRTTKLRARAPRIDYQKVSGEILAAMTNATAKGGLSSEELQRMTGRAKREVFPTLGRLLQAGRISKTGVKRATRYFMR